MRIILRAIIPPQGLSSMRFRGLLLSRLERIGVHGVRIAQTTSNNWESINPEFDYEFGYAGGNISVIIGTDSDIWNWIDEGTSERWAVMNNPFVSKTRPGNIQSGTGVRTYNGAGEYTAIRGRYAMMKRGIPARPGITARNFSDQIGEQLMEELDKEISDAMDEAFG